jgi:hypothetical protein
LTHARQKITDLERQEEEQRLRADGLVVMLDATAKELKKLADARAVDPIIERVPGPTKVVEVIKWKTKEVPVTVTKEKIKEIFKLTDCTDLVLAAGTEEDDEWVEPLGYIEGQVVKVETRKGNAVVSGFAECIIEDTVFVDEEFDWDATEAWNLARRQDAKRWWAGLDYSLYTRSPDVSAECASTYPGNANPPPFSCTASASVDKASRFAVEAGRVWFPLKRYSIGTGVEVGTDHAAATVKVFF